MPKSVSQQSRLMHYFSRLAGPERKLAMSGGKQYRVRFVPLTDKEAPLSRYWIKILAYGAMVLTILFAGMLFRLQHWVIIQQPTAATHLANIAMLVCLCLLQIFVIIATFSATRSTMKAKDPVPVRPPRGYTVAFVTTRAPGEPVSLVRNTLEAALRVRYKQGSVTVWLLDETADPLLWELCVDLGVQYFSRNGISEWNTTRQAHRSSKNLLQSVCDFIRRRTNVANPSQPAYNPFFAARSKHGNYNSWMAYLKLHGIRYDILAGVDTDQVPEPNYLERMLGYFRDPDVAYVVGPQVYSNYQTGLHGLLARWAESQASFFQSTIQRAGNHSQSAMFVGTNYVVRMNVLDQIGGFQPCITEDMATGLVIHSRRNPETGQHWTSVYTPDVLACGEGPAYWAPYFTQQWRWAAGTFDTWRHIVWRVFFKLSPKAMLHYLLILTYYPITALTWLLAIVSSLLYLSTGATALLAPWNEFISLYAMTLVMQLSLYFWNRRYSVSPFEPARTYGVPGLVLSSLTAPIYLSALLGVLFGNKPDFVVTAKGSNVSPDTLQTFKLQLGWSGLLVAGILFGAAYHHNHPAMLVWAYTLIVICLAPVGLYMAVSIPNKLINWIQQQVLILGASLVQPQA